MAFSHFATVESLLGVVAGSSPEKDTPVNVLDSDFHLAMLDSSSLFFSRDQSK